MVGVVELRIAQGVPELIPGRTAFTDDGRRVDEGDGGQFVNDAKWWHGSGTSWRADRPSRIRCVASSDRLRPDLAAASRISVRMGSGRSRMSRSGMTTPPAN